MGEPRPAAGVEPGLLAASLAMALLLMAFGALATLFGAIVCCGSCPASAS